MRTRIEVSRAKQRGPESLLIVSFASRAITFTEAALVACCHE
jgi:hypothetical protein